MHFFQRKVGSYFAFLEGYAVHECINPCLSVTHAFTPKFLSVNDTILCLIKEIASRVINRLNMLCNIS